MKILTVIGARPQFIKAAVVSRAIEKYNVKNTDKIDEIIVNTGQHYDKNMSDIFFCELGIPLPDYDLGVGSGSHGAQTGEMLKKIEEIILIERPGMVLVYGDTNSTIAGALAASKLLIPVIHVEAGLRSHNMAMPEEQNRILTDHISSYLFCPTETAVKNLLAEGIENGRRGKYVVNTGDVMFDAIIHNRSLAVEKSDILTRLKCIKGNFILATVHRAENTNSLSNLTNIFRAFKEIGQRAILPLHPRTKKYIEQYSIDVPENIEIIEPVGYLDMLSLESNAKIIATDSGGVQKEAYFMKIPCITLRQETEWVETLENGWNQLVGASPERIVSGYKNAVEKDVPVEYNNCFGDGNSGEKIVGMLMNG